MKRIDIAEVCHEANRDYCKSLSDDSQPEWKDAPEWMRSSVLNGVNLHLDNPETGPAASHESWMKEKLDNGWKYGPVKNAEAKEHPCIMPFLLLPTEQKAKDYIFRGIVHVLARYVED